MGQGKRTFETLCSYIPDQMHLHLKVWHLTDTLIQSNLQKWLLQWSNDMQGKTCQVHVAKFQSCDETAQPSQVYKIKVWLSRTTPRLN